MPRRGEGRKRPTGIAHRKSHAYEVACRMVERGYTLAAIAGCKRTPSLRKLERWIAEDDDFRTRFETARDRRRERLVESIVVLADDRTLSTTDRRLRIDARKWRVALMDKDNARQASKEASAESGVLSDEMVRILEAGLPTYGQSAAAAEQKASGADDVRRYETTEMEPEPLQAAPIGAMPDASEDPTATDGASSWTIKFPDEVSGEGVTAGPPPDGWWK